MAVQMEMTPSEQMSNFVVNLRFEDLPAAVIANAKERFLDIIGLALATSKTDPGRAIRDAVVEWGGKPQSSVIGFGDKLPTPNAALINGTLAHGLDFDDTHTLSIVHASATTVPTVLAMGEAKGIGGRDLITAAVAGWETVVRIGMAAPGQFHERGLHPTSLCGSFGSAFAAGKIMGLGAEDTANAVGICGSMASGILEGVTEGAWVKPVHAGWGSHCGIMAAQLASKGITGAHTVFEGQRGLFHSHLCQDNYDLSQLTAGLGKEWETLNISFKPYPACHFTHACMDCALRLRREHNIDYNQIEDIECIVPELITGLFQAEPPTPYAAKFSIPFVVALMLVRGQGTIHDFSEERINDRQILNLANKVRSGIETDSEFPRHFPGWVRIKMKDGKIYECRQRVERGGAESPLEKGELEGKFHTNVRGVISEERAQHIIDSASRLEELSDVSDLMRLCQP